MAIAQTILFDKSVLTAGVCMNVFWFIPIISVTALFNFIKCVNAIIEIVCMNHKKKNIRALIKLESRVVCDIEMIVQLPKKSMIPIFVVPGNKIKIAEIDGAPQNR